MLHILAMRLTHLTQFGSLIPLLVTDELTDNIQKTSPEATLYLEGN